MDQNDLEKKSEEILTMLDELILQQHLKATALEGGVPGRTSLKIEGKGNSEMTLLSAYITLKMQMLTPVSHLKLK